MRPMASVYVVVPDHPGEWRGCSPTRARGEVNIEDVRVDHDPAARSGWSSWVVAVERVDHCLASLCTPWLVTARQAHAP